MNWLSCDGSSAATRCRPAPTATRWCAARARPATRRAARPHRPEPVTLGPAQRPAVGRPGVQGGPRPRSPSRPYRSAGAAVWEGIVAATGVPHGQTTYAPGAIGRSLGRRTPKGTYGRSWLRPVAQVLAAEELEPGDAPARHPRRPPLAAAITTSEQRQVPGARADLHQLPGLAVETIGGPHAVRGVELPPRLGSPASDIWARCGRRGRRDRANASGGVGDTVGSALASLSRLLPGQGRGRSAGLAWCLQVLSPARGHRPCRRRRARPVEDSASSASARDRSRRLGSRAFVPKPR